GMRISNTYLSGLVVRNNIISGNKNGVVTISSGVPLAAVTRDHNLESNDPGFVSSGDFRLQPGSPAIDAGHLSLSPVVDLAGLARPQAATVDIGAYEHPFLSVTNDSHSLYLPLVGAGNKSAATVAMAAGETAVAPEAEFVAEGGTPIPDEA